MFRTQLRALMRAAVHGQVNVLFPMLTHPREIAQTLAQVRLARAELDARGVLHGPTRLGAMIEVPPPHSWCGTFCAISTFSRSAPTT